MALLESMTLLLLMLVAGDRLSQSDVQLLIENTPDFINAANAKRCPRAEVLWDNNDEAAYQVRSRCTGSPSGLIGNYLVDKRNGEIWLGVDRDERVTSKRLLRLQKKLLKQLQTRQPKKQQ